MATERLKIVMDAVWRGGSQVKKAEGDIAGVDQAAKKGGLSIGKLATGLGVATVAFGAATVAARATWSVLKQGAQLDTTARKFDKLAISIGTTGEALKRDLNDGIGLLMSNAEQMGLATDLMSLGLAKTHEEATRLSSVAGQLGMDMNQLVLTLTNKTTMRFDSLGIAVDGFKGRVEALEQAGYSADEAFKWAFIEQAEGQLEKVGSKAGTTEGALIELESATKNARDAFSGNFASSFISQMEASGGAARNTAADIAVLTGALGEFMGFATGGAIGAFAQIVSDAERQNQWLVSQGNGSFRRRTHGSPGARAGGRGNAGYSNYGASSRRHYGLSNAVEQTRIQRENQQSLAAVNAQAGKTQKGLDSLAAAEAEVAANWDGVDRSVQEAEESLSSMGGTIGFVANEMDILNAATGDYFMQARRSKDFNPFEAAMDAAGGANAFQLAKFGVAGGLFSEAEGAGYINKAALMQQADMVGKLMGEGMSGEEAAAILAGVQAGLEDGSILADEFFKDIENTKPESMLELNIDAAWARYLALIGMIENTPPGIPGPRGSGGGGSGGSGGGTKPSGGGDDGTTTDAAVVVHSHTKESMAVALAYGEQITRGRLGLM